MYSNLQIFTLGYFASIFMVQLLCYPLHCECLASGELSLGGFLELFSLGMGKGPTRTLELVDSMLESRPLSDPCPRSLGLDLDLTQKRA